MDDVAIVSKIISVQLITKTTTPENLVDCSISKIIKRSQISTKLAILGRIKGVNTSLTINLNVQKVGAISELTKGKIVFLNGKGCRLICVKINQSTPQLYPNKMNT